MKIVDLINPVIYATVVSCTTLLIPSMGNRRYKTVNRLPETGRSQRQESKVLVVHIMHNASLGKYRGVVNQ